MTDRSAAERIKHRRENAVDPETFLLEAEAITPTADDADFRFTDAYARAIKAQLEAIRELGVDEHHIAAIFDADVEDVSAVERPNPAYKIYHTIRNWSSDAALMLDVAMDRALADRSDEWADVPGGQRHRILKSLRLFQDECLFCGGPASVGEPIIRETPTGVHELTPFQCGECDRLFAEFMMDEVSDDTITSRRDG